ncbi:MAG TPA: hypothetical protein VFN21_12350, partial [Acidimicrobiales bacterium]|nr:hypothetical protein [Acidimicrobiales bacterium]
MSDEHEAPPAAAAQRGAVARLAEAVAAAQAVAREGAAELGSDATADTEVVAGKQPDVGRAAVQDGTEHAPGRADSGDASPASEASDATLLRDRIGALPLVGADRGPDDPASGEGDATRATGAGVAPPVTVTSTDTPAGASSTTGSRRPRRRFWPLYLAMVLLVV